MKVKIKDPAKYNLDDWLKIYSNDGVINVVCYELANGNIYEWRTPEGLYTFKKDELIFMEDTTVEKPKSQRSRLLDCIKEMDDDYEQMAELCQTLADIYELASEYSDLIEINIKESK